MTRQEILDLQEKHTEIHKKEIKPLKELVHVKEMKLKSEFQAALELHYDSIFKDKNGNTIKEGCTFQVKEFQVELMSNGAKCWLSEFSLLKRDKYKKERHEWDYKKTGKTRKTVYRCKKRCIQFLFGEMMNNPHVYACRVRNGKELKTEYTFSPAECKHVNIID